MYQYCPTICLLQNISPLGRSTYESFGISRVNRTPAGVGKVRIQCEVKARGSLFNGSGLLNSTTATTGIGGSGASAIQSILANCPTASSPCHWRVRMASRDPFFPRSPWFSMPHNGANEADVNTAGGVVAVEPGGQRPASVWMGASHPNPSRAATRVAYSLPRESAVRVTVRDVAGRKVRTLLDGMQPAGDHTVSWDGATQAGAA